MTISDDDITRLLNDEPGLTQHGHDRITDTVTAETLVARHGRNLHYIDPWKQWLIWTGQRWEQDTTLQAEHLTKAVLRRLLQEATHIEDQRQRTSRIKDLIAAERASRVRGALDLAKSEPLIAIKPDELDNNTHLLNTQNATINLQTGQAEPHQRRDLITKLAPVTHDPEATAPTWQQFLHRVLPDPDTRLFLQRATGYSLIGGNPAQILLILYGSGANGKSTFIELIRHLYGDYGQQAPPETFLTHRDGIPNDVARLRGARFVAASEIGEGRKLNEPLIKRMTGGDTMTARFMRAEYFEFQPQFTPWLATNHKPEIRGTDEAIWRRIRLIPFTQTIPAAERDHHLPQKLREELPGILNWALDGALAYQADGLAEPTTVKQATDEYRNDEDDVGRFLDDTCDLQDDHRVRSADLYRTYTDWCKATGEVSLSATSFGRRLSERGYLQTRNTSSRLWVGIKPKTDQNELDF